MHTHLNALSTPSLICHELLGTKHLLWKTLCFCGKSWITAWHKTCTKKDAMLLLQQEQPVQQLGRRLVRGALGRWRRSSAQSAAPASTTYGDAPTLRPVTQSLAEFPPPRPRPARGGKGQPSATLPCIPQVILTLFCSMGSAGPWQGKKRSQISVAGA